MTFNIGVQIVEPIFSTAVGWTFKTGLDFRFCLNGSEIVAHVPFSDDTFAAGISSGREIQVYSPIHTGALEIWRRSMINDRRRSCVDTSRSSSAEVRSGRFVKRFKNRYVLLFLVGNKIVSMSSVCPRFVCLDRILGHDSFFGVRQGPKLVPTLLYKWRQS